MYKKINLLMVMIVTILFSCEKTEPVKLQDSIESEITSVENTQIETVESTDAIKDISIINPSSPAGMVGSAGPSKKSPGERASVHWTKKE